MRHRMMNRLHSIRVVPDDATSASIKAAIASALPAHELLLPPSVHGAFEEERDAATRIKSVFTSLTDQIDQFKSRFEAATEKLWSEEDRNAFLEERIEILEEEKLVFIEANLEVRENVRLGKIFKPVMVASNFIRTDEDLRGDNIRRALLFDDYEENGVLSLDVLYGNGAGGFLSALVRAFLAKMTPFKRDIRKVTSQFGHSVASFFIFYRFIFLQSVLISLIAATFAIFHVINILKRGDKVALTSRGLLPGFMLYSSFEESEQVYYAAVIISGLLASFVFLLLKYIREDLITKQLAAMEEENVYTYGNDCFCAWDFSISSKLEADDFSGSLVQHYCLLLSETRDSGRKNQRSSADLLSLYVRRFSGFILYIIVQCISFVLIILVTFNENNFSNALQGVSGLSTNFIALLAQLIPPALLTSINYATPALFLKITDLEQWDKASTEINVLLLRMFCSSTLNLLLLAFSYALLADPFLLADHSNLRYNLAVKPSKTFDCRMDQVANGLFTLVVFSFVIKAAAMILSPLMQMAQARITSKAVVKYEFAIANRIVETLNLISVVYLSFPFAPLSLMFLPFLLYITLKWEKYTTLRFQSKPKRPWKAEKAGAVFTMFYLISLCIIGIPSGIFFFATKTFPKSCAFQDDYIQLCLTRVIEGMCETNAASPYYTLYGHTSLQYPGNICTKSCGPFVDVQGSNLDPLVTAMRNNRGMLGVMDSLFYHPYLPWAVTTLLLVVVRLRNNSMSVMASQTSRRESAMNDRILKLDGEQKRQAKIISRMRSIEREEEANTSFTKEKKVDAKFKVKPSFGSF